MYIKSSMSKKNIHHSKTMRASGYYHLAPLSLFVFTALYGPFTFATTTPSEDKTSASGVEFDATFLSTGNDHAVDLTRFSDGASSLPGEYSAGIYVNDELIINDKVTLKGEGNNTAVPCVTAEILKKTSIKLSQFPSDTLNDDNKNRCVDVEKFIPGSRVSFDSNEVRLNIRIPQMYMNHKAQGYVDPSLWDSGIPAFLLNYNLSTYASESRGQNYRSAYGLISSGVNIGAWYFRHNGSMTIGDDGEKKYSAINSYVQRDITALRGRLSVGQLNTTGEVFDTLPFTGLQLNSDDRMLPGSMQGYAPEIRGIARTTAQVTVRQSGQIIYETTVSPGAFLISDLYPTGYGGNLQVTVREADGSVQYFEVPYASVAHLLRPGSQRYSLAVGKYRNAALLDESALYQATYQRGLNNMFTGYGGLQASKNYAAINTGIAMGTKIGALSFDVTSAQSRLQSSENQSSATTSRGQSIQLGYSKTISETNSNLSLAAYRFSTRGYMDYQTAMLTRDALQRGAPTDAIYRAKNRVTITAGQGLPGEWGNFYLSASMQDYWNKEGSDQMYQFGYNNRYKLLSYGISVNRSRDGFGKFQNSFLLSFTLPLGRNDMTNVPQLRVDLTKDSNGLSTQQTNISGTAGKDSQFNYGVTATHGSQGQGTNGSLNGGYRSPYTAITGNYSVGRDYQSQGLSLSGSIIAHKHGVTLSPYSGETLALVEAKGAKGATVSGYPGIRIDSNGYAIVPYLNPYQMNDVYLDPKGASSDVELKNTSQNIAPISGAVVMVKFDTRNGTPVLINASFNNEPVPFGASVLDDKGNSVGAVGQGGQIYARVEQERGQLTVKWGDDARSQCQVKYILSPQNKDATKKAIQQFNSTCQA